MNLVNIYPKKISMCLSLFDLPLFPKLPLAMILEQYTTDAYFMNKRAVEWVNIEQSHYNF